MPIAFFLVAMIALLGGWYQMENQAQEMEMIRKSEAQAVASSITSYHLKVVKCARYKDASGVMPHWNRFSSFNGTAQSFLADCSGTPGPDWISAPLDGVNMTISAGKITVTYNPVRGLHASRAGVQGELNRMTHNSIILGQPIWGY